jgi:hypothetical protein
MSHKESKSNNNNNDNLNNNKESDEALPFGGYQGGSLRWNTMRKRSRYTRRYKDSDMMWRILSTRIDP